MFDDEGVERTPRPMLYLRPSGVPKAAGSGADDPGSPRSELSDNFLDRMSCTGFSKGMFSASGTASPQTSDGSDEARRQDKVRLVLVYEGDHNLMYIVHRQFFNR